MSRFFNASLVGSLLFFRSFQSLSVKGSRGDSFGFPFVFETLLFLPFIAQCLFYFGGLARGAGSVGAAGRELIVAVPHLGPCVRYAVLSASSPVLETYSMGYLDGSTVIIIKQLTILCIAFFDAFLLSVYPTLPLILSMTAQCGMVVLFNVDGARKAGRASDGTTAAAGIVDGDGTAVHAVLICLVSVCLSSLATVLQQKFLQRQAPTVPLNAKLFYQHVIAFSVVVAKLFSNPASVSRLRVEGFFAGWNSWALAASLSTWLCYLTSTAVTAHVSAMAGAMAQAVSIVVISVGESLVFGVEFTDIQRVLIFGICANAVFFVHCKARQAKAKDEVGDKAK